MRDETFGPVLPIMKVPTTRRRCAWPTTRRYGLNSSVWTSDDASAASAIAARLEAGNVCINDCIVSYGVCGLPFGGVKESGIGRVHGAEGLQEFSHVKSVLGQRVKTAAGGLVVPGCRRTSTRSASPASGCGSAGGSRRVSAASEPDRRAAPLPQVRVKVRSRENVKRASVEVGESGTVASSTTR